MSEEADAIAVLASFVGTWDVALTIRPTPTAPPISQRAVVTNRLVGGRWLVVDHRTESGFEGHGVYGWDDDVVRYTGIWVDGAGAGVVRVWGLWDATSRTLTWDCETVHAGRAHKYREITTTRADGTRLYRHLVPTSEGGEHEMITAVHTRRPDDDAPLPVVGHMSGW